MGEALQGGRSDCGCAYEISSDLLNRFRGFCGSNPCISVGFLDDHTSARFKSYQFLKVVSGGRAPGKSSSFASSQLLVIERFHCSSSFSFSQTVASSLCIVSFVHSVLLLLKSNHCGIMIVCNAKQCWQKSSLQCEGWALLCLL